MFVEKYLPILLPAFTWVLLWSAGGILMSRRAFRLRPSEEWIVGLAVGWVANTWLANLMEWFLPLSLAYWAAAGVVFAGGLAYWGKFWLNLREVMRIRLSAAPLAALLLITYTYTMTGRGLGIFDDYQNLPVTSILAAGMFPPPFVLDPQVNFGYHYFTLFSAAQFMHIFGLAPWTALDLARGWAMGLCVVLAGTWFARVLQSRLAGAIGAVVFMFGMGTRWLMLLLPVGLLARISDSIHMIGSGRSTAPTFLAAMTATWAVEGSGPMSIPFAFSNGIFYPPIMFHNGTAMAPVLIVFALLLVSTRINSWRGWILVTVLMAALGLLVEVPVVMSIGVWGLIAVGWALQHRSLRLPRNLTAWLVTAAIAFLFVLFQGGVITAALLDIMNGWTGNSSGSGYFTLRFPFKFPPAVISAHLGSLSFFNPFQLLAALFETGPILLVFPLLCIWGWKAYRSGSWYQANYIGAGLVSVVFFFFEYTGSAGISATTRLQGMVLNVSQVFMVPLAWIWLRTKGVAWKIFGGFAVFLMCYGGIVLFGLQMVAIQRPIYAEWLGGLDAQVYQEQWNRLEKDALVFDPIAWRPATILARLTNSNVTWYESKPGWDKLVDFPDPFSLRKWGFTHAYIDRQYWRNLSPQAQQALQSACVRRVHEYVSKGDDFRWILDLRACQ